MVQVRKRQTHAQAELALELPSSPPAGVSERRLTSLSVPEWKPVISIRYTVFDKNDFVSGNLDTVYCFQTGWHRGAYAFVPAWMEAFLFFQESHDD